MKAKLMRMKDAAVADGATGEVEVWAPFGVERWIRREVVVQELAVRVGPFEDDYAAESVSWIK